jgi:hypothetical protein
VVPRRFAPDSTEIAETREAAPGVIIDLDAQRNLSASRS